MKKLGRLLCVMLAAAVVTAACALPASALVSGDWEYTLADSEVTVTKYKGSEDAVAVPSSLGGFPVKAVGEKAFSGYRDGEASDGVSVTIPEGVESIGEGAFSFTGIGTVNLPSTLKTIGKSAFYESGIARISLPEGLETIGDGAFFECMKLSSVTVPSTVKAFGTSVFEGSGLVTAVMEYGVASIGDSAFKVCESLESVSIPDSVTSIGSSAFSGCEKLESLVIPWGITSLSYGFMNNCPSVKEFVIPTSVTTIEGSAFRYCSGLKTLVIPNSVTKMADCVGFCDALETISIPSSVTKIEFRSFGKNLTAHVVRGSAADEAVRGSGCSYVYDDSVDADIQVLYNGSRISFGAYGQSPVVESQRTFVPLRSIFETMGATVTWDGDTNTVTSVRGGTTVKLTLGSNTMYVNGSAKTLDVEPFAMNQRTLVPVRAIAEAFGASVGWNQAGRLVTIAE